MKKAVIYARFSCERQTEQSIDGQLSVCRAYAEQNGITVVGEYIDRAISGRTDDRPDFQRMLHDSASQEWEYVLVYKGDRFARNRFDSAINKNLLKQNGVRVLSATEHIPETPEGIVLEAILEGYAEYYSAELSQKVRRGMNESRKKRQFLGGQIPYGYNVVDKHFVINKTEASVVYRVFDSYSKVVSVSEILATLKAENITNKKGENFTFNAINRMLGMEIYTGIYRHEDEVYAETYPRIIDDALWERVQAIRNAHKRTKTRRGVTHYLLSGKVFCGECGGRMQGESGTGRNGEEHYYYKCRDKKMRKNDCHSKAIRKGELEDIVYYACCDVLDGGAIHALAEKILATTQQAFAESPMLDSFKAQLKDKEKAINNLYKAVMDGLATDGIRKLIEDTEREISDLRVRIADEEAKTQVHFTLEHFEQFLSRLVDEHANNPEFKKQLISMLVRSVTVYRDRVKITFFYSPDGGGKKDYESETEIPPEYPIGSGLDTQPSPSGLNPNITIFVSFDFWGVWVKRETR